MTEREEFNQFLTLLLNSKFIDNLSGEFRVSSKTNDAPRKKITYGVWRDDSGLRGNIIGAAGGMICVDFLLPNNSNDLTLYLKGETVTLPTISGIQRMTSEVFSS